ncbi:MAG: serine hydrolase domain-containing protein [Phycisphaerae bacterium]
MVRTERLSPAIDAIVAEQVEPDGPGVALLVVHAGKILHAQGYGMADVEHGIPLTPISMMRTASVSKQFTAMAVLLLAEDGAIRLDDPVRRFFDSPVYEGMTVRHLLQHTSGLADYFDVFEKDWDRSKIVTNDDLIEWYTRTAPKPAFASGEQWQYSDGGYSLLASIVAKVSGRSFPAFVRERIFAPLGMNRSLFFNLAQPEPMQNRAWCYDKSADGRFERVDGSYMNGVVGEGGLYTTLLDYYLWDQALYGERLLPHERIEEAYTPAVLNDGTQAIADDAMFCSDPGYGYGWITAQRGGRRIVFHPGDWYGARALTIRHIDERCTLALLSNNGEISLADIARRVDTLVRAHLGLGDAGE